MVAALKNEHFVLIVQTGDEGECLQSASWAEALGEALERAERAGAPDTPETYYLAVVSALETLSERFAEPSGWMR